jgi:hypothetical protein
VTDVRKAQAENFAATVAAENVSNTDLDLSDGATRAEAAVTLKLAGASYTQIAEHLHYTSATRAREAVERALAQAAASEETRDQMRVLISRRLDRLLQAVMPRAVHTRDPDHLAYNKAALAIVDRQARLFGVDAPTQVHFTTPDSAVIEEYVARMTALARSERSAEEADIMDAEVIEDGEPEA